MVDDHTEVLLFEVSGEAAAGPISDCAGAATTMRAVVRSLNQTPWRLDRVIAFSLMNFQR
jgi:hypothetical protein